LDENFSRSKRDTLEELKGGKAQVSVLVMRNFKEKPRKFQMIYSILSDPRLLIWLCFGFAGAPAKCEPS
jgi:hypothetical protein